MVRVLVLLFLFFPSFAFAELVPDSCYYNETSGEGFPDVNCYFRINGGWASPNPLLTSLYNDYCIGPAAGTWELRTNAGGKGWSGLRLVYHSSGCNFTVWYENAFYSADLVEVDDPNEDPDCTDCDIVFCPSKDDDGDGVYDQLSMGNICDYPDQCLNTPAGEEVDAAGCSATQRDTDGDSIKDAYDRCPFDAGLPSADGCPDSDGDGVGDNFDLCPGTLTSEDNPYITGSVDLSGCPTSLEVTCDALPEGYVYSQMVVNDSGSYCAKYVNFSTGDSILCGCTGGDNSIPDCSEIDSTWRNMGHISGSTDTCNFTKDDIILTCSCDENSTYEQPDCFDLRKSIYYQGPDTDREGYCIYFNGLFSLSCLCDSSGDDNGTEDNSSVSDSCPTCLGSMISQVNQQIGRVTSAVNAQGKNLSKSGLEDVLSGLSFSSSGGGLSKSDLVDVFGTGDSVDTDSPVIPSGLDGSLSRLSDEGSYIEGNYTSDFSKLIDFLPFGDVSSHIYVTTSSDFCSLQANLSFITLDFNFCTYADFLNFMGNILYGLACLFAWKIALTGGN